MILKTLKVELYTEKYSTVTLKLLLTPNIKEKISTALFPDMIKSSNTPKQKALFTGGLSFTQTYYVDVTKCLPDTRRKQNLNQTVLSCNEIIKKCTKRLKGYYKTN